MSQGQMGVIEVFDHFTCLQSATMGTTALPVGSEGVMHVSDQEGSFAQTATEPGGVLAITNDSDDDDNCFLYVGPFKPSDGGVVMEVRFSVDAVDDCAIYAGFQETLNATTPVMPAEYATDSFAYNSSIGGFAGLQFDCDGTTDDWRAVAGDNAIAAWDADSDATTARANNAPVANKWDVVRVEVDASRNAHIYLAGDGTDKSLELVKESTSAVMADSCQLYAVLGVENRANNATTVWQVDYFYARGYVDWTQ